MNQYHTHSKYLKELLEKFDYKNEVKCLEFGSGDGSGSIFSDFAKKYDKLQIECFEHDQIWIEQMIKKYALDNYKYNLISWDKFDYTELKKSNYDLVFVDQGDWDARIETIDQLRDNTRYFILHDYCYYNGLRGYSIPEDQKLTALDLGQGSFFHQKYSEDFDLIGENEFFPPTLVLKKRQSL